MASDPFPNPRPIVRKCRGLVFVGTWYVKAFGHCYRFPTWRRALYWALCHSQEHKLWARKVAPKRGTKIVTKSKLEKLLNSLSLRPLRNCKSLHRCCLCDQDITMGQDYRDGGLDRRAHQSCFLSKSYDRLERGAK